MTKKQILITGVMMALSVAGFLTSATPALAQVAPRTITMNLVGPNGLPFLPGLVATFGDIVSFTAIASDSFYPNQSFIYGLSVYPSAPAATIDPTTGVFTWNTDSIGGCGNHDFRVTATGSASGETVEQLLGISVTSPPGTLCLPTTPIGTSTMITLLPAPVLATVGTPIVTLSGGILMTMEIPPLTTITGPVGWHGLLYLPTATTTTDTNAVSSIFVGFGDMLLTFNRGVRLNFIGQAGNSISYTHGVNTPTEITNTCLADTQDAGDALPTGGDCKMNVGSDLVVWTKHFSTFTTRAKLTIKVQASIVPKDEIALNSNATVQVAVFGSSDFDATMIDPERTTLAGTPVSHAANNHPLVSYRDVNRDGITDAVLHFKTDELHLNASDTNALLDGYTTGGVHFEAMVPVEIKTPKK